MVVEICAGNSYVHVFLYLIRPKLLATHFPSSVFLSLWLLSLSAI